MIFYDEPRGVWHEWGGCERQQHVNYGMCGVACVAPPYALLREERLEGFHVYPEELLPQTTPPQAACEECQRRMGKPRPDGTAWL